MQGVTTAIVGFIFLCIAFPHFVKHKPQFYAAVACVLGIIFLDAFFHDNRFFYAMSAMLQILSIVLLILAAGGLTAREFAGEMVRAYEVIRRGEEEKTVIIPLSGQQAKRAKQEHQDEGRVVYEIDPELAKAQAQATQQNPKPAAPAPSAPPIPLDPPQ